MPLPRLHAGDFRVWPAGAVQCTARISPQLQPAPYARAVATIDIAELALEIGFLAGHYAVADDEREGHQRQQQPEIVERDAKPIRPRNMPR